MSSPITRAARASAASSGRAVTSAEPKRWSPAHDRAAGGGGCGMASYSVNEAGVAQARRLIEARQYVLSSNWSDVQPGADEQNAYLDSHSWDDYGAWHLALTDGAGEETKARFGFGYGDFRRVHRSALMAC